MIASSDQSHQYSKRSTILQKPLLTMMFCALTSLLILSNLYTSSASPISVTNNHVCLLPKEVGPCKAALARFFFNSQSGSCEEFNYGGCDGNENNFKTLEECQAACPCNHGPLIGGEHDTKIKPENPTVNEVTTNDVIVVDEENQQSSTDPCFLHPDMGNCFGMFFYYYFDYPTGQCRQFLYGGCGGNANRFETLEECEKKCRHHQEHTKPFDAKTSCHLPPQMGDCKAFFERYFFNDTTNTCQSFVYSGCHGNANNFESEEECVNKCQSEVV